MGTQACLAWTRDHNYMCATVGLEIFALEIVVRIDVFGFVDKGGKKTLVIHNS